MTTATVTYHELPPLTSWIADSQQQEPPTQQQTHSSPPASVPITTFVAAVPLGIEQQDQQFPQVLTDHRQPQHHSLAVPQEIFCTQALNHYRTGHFLILADFRAQEDSESTSTKTSKLVKISFSTSFESLIYRSFFLFIFNIIFLSLQNLVKF